MTVRKTYDRNGLTCVLDRARGFLVQRTPEELVRQDTLDWLLDHLRIPARLVRSEFNTRSRGGTGRADIVVFTSGRTPEAEREAILVVECKSDAVFLDDRALRQASDYAETVAAMYVLLTDGNDRRWFAKRSGEWRRLTKGPTWAEMRQRKGLRWDETPPPARLDWSQFLRPATCTAAVAGLRNAGKVGSQTPWELTPFMVNLMGCLEDPNARPELPIADERIEIIEDLGPRTRLFGNASGGRWASDSYRSLLIRDRRTASHQVASLALLGSINGRTYFLVALDEGPATHLSLEFDLDRAINRDELARGHVSLRHDGRLTAGTLGAVARDAVLSHVARMAPHLLVNGMVSLGSLPSSRTIEWADALPVVLRAIRYALVRDDLRREMKARAAASPAVSSWKHGDLVKARWEGKVLDPVRFIRPVGRTRALVHWGSDDKFSKIPLRDIVGRSTKGWNREEVEPDVEIVYKP